MRCGMTEANADASSLDRAEQIRAAFQELTHEEELVDDELERILLQQVLIESKLRELTQFAASLHGVRDDADKLAAVIGFTAKLADGVSSKVKQLDRTKGRVSDCQQRVHDLIDLKLCSDGVRSALADEDYEKAAAHLHRFLLMDENLLKLTASDVQEETFAGKSGLDSALKTLHDAEVQVKEIIADRFDKAVKSEDTASIERFFKLFPLINMHDEGLLKFTSYLCGKLGDPSKKNLKQALDTVPSDPRFNIIFADTLTLLFEGIARTVEIHQPLIETYYGPGRLLTTLSLIQSECDKQAERIIGEYRKKRSLRDVAARVRAALNGSANDKISPKEIDHILSEMILLQARSEMYYTFVRRRIGADIDVSTDDVAIRKRKMSELEQCISRSGLCRSMQELLSEYILLEDYFMSQNIMKAIEHDTLQAGSVVLSETDPETSALLDDIFFLMKKCIQRAFGSQNVDGVCAIINDACRVLEQDFCGMLQSQLKMGFPTGYLDLTYNVIHSSFQQGKLQAGDTEKQKLVFLAALNNADSASDYIARLMQSLLKDITMMTSSRNEHEREKMESCLAGLPAINGRLKSILEQGMQQLRQTVVKPRIKPWMDSFISHDVNEDQFADFEANDPFVQVLIMNLDNLLTGFKKLLTNNNFDALVAILTTEVTAQMEKVVLKSSFSRLGGLLLDREVRSLISFLTTTTTWSIRDRFARLSQVAAILNIESTSELVDVYNSGNSKLSPAEARQVLSLRTDFKLDEIKKLRL